MAQLAIKGHATRGNEVIEILEMLGGENKFQREGDNKDRFYYIDKNKHIQTTCGSLSYTLFTLEEFLEKFPYKIGDKILYKTYGIYLRIKTMLWNVEKEQVFYRLGTNKLFVATADELQPYKEQIKEDKPDLLQQLKEYFENTPREVLEKEWHEYDKYNEIGPSVEEYLEYVNSIKQPQLPKTFVECCEILYPNENFQTVAQPIKGHNKKLFALQKLLICRDAYWKIAGEQMGLGKSWNQDYDNRCFIIANTKGNINTYEYHGNNNVILAFPSEEMRDMFLENFRKSIEECKEFL